MKRSVSFLLIALIYIAAVAVGVGVYCLLPFSFWLNLLLADVAATAFTFLFSLFFKNASVYDPYWSVQPPVILLAFALVRPVTVASVLMLIVVWLWGARLTANWAYTFHGLGHQDWRYTMLREKSGRLYPLVNFFGIHTVPTLVVYACTLPAVFLIRSGAACNIWTVLGCLLSLFSVLLQGTADWQMHAFRRIKVGGFIRNGLWKYSRHPNYLAEILMWWGVAIAAIGTLGFAWYLPLGAIANTLLFLCISIPLADGRQARKEGFVDYKRETRMLLPIPRLQADSPEELKRKRRICALISVALAVVILFVVCAAYLGTYYRADAKAIAAFSYGEGVTETLDREENAVFVPQQIKAGVIFYPGGKVEHRAYAPLMRSLAERGVLCVLVEMPFRLAVLDTDAAEGIREQFPQVERWYLAGHSLGGSMAADYLSDHPEGFEGLILLGSYSTADLAEGALRVLSVYGSRDQVLDRAKYEKNKRNLPTDLTEIEIEGGCHSYFGVYGIQKGDGIPTLTNSEQIRLTADLIEDFLD